MAKQIPFCQIWGSDSGVDTFTSIMTLCQSTKHNIPQVWIFNSFFSPTKTHFEYVLSVIKDETMNAPKSLSIQCTLPPHSCSFQNNYPYHLPGARTCGLLQLQNTHTHTHTHTHIYIYIYIYIRFTILENNRKKNRDLIILTVPYIYSFANHT
jgi:hypothetical protein